MNGRKVLGLSLGIAVSGAFLWFIFQSIPLDDFLETVKGANIRWLCVGIGFFFLGYACRIWRWRLMLVPYNADLGFGKCAVPFMVSIATNNVLPFRAGDVLRGVAFSRWLGVPMARILATLFAERLLDVFSLIVALTVALTLVGRGETDVQALLGSAGWVFLLAACVIVCVLLFPRIFEDITQRLVGSLSKRAPETAEKIKVQVTYVFQTLSGLAQRSRMMLMIFWSLMAWFFEACVFYAIAMALADITVPAAAWLAMPVGTLSTMLPSTPGYVGTFHYFVMQAAIALGNPEIAAAAFAFLVHLALYVPATLCGGVCFVYWVLTRTSDSPPSIERTNPL